MRGNRQAVTSDAVIFLPGVMGSELIDAQGRIVWGMKVGLLFRQSLFLDALQRLIPRPGDGIHASRPIQFPAAIPLLSSMNPYGELEARLRQVAAAPEAVRPFAYDWRRSVADASRELAPVARDHLHAWRKRWQSLPKEERQGLPEPRLTLVGHSMGGLVASYFAAFGEGGEEAHRVVTLGTPFGGSLNAVRVLATGEQLPLDLFAPSLRDAVRHMPGLYELLPRWPCVANGDTLRKITPSDLAAVGADVSLAKAAGDTIDAIDSALQGKAGRRPSLRCLVGTAQPTRQSVRLDAGTATFDESIKGVDHRGDGTVFRYAACPEGTTPSYLPQSHGALAKSQEAIEYAAAVLTELPLGAFQAPPGLGLRVPEMVKAGELVDAEILDAKLGTVTCLIHDADDGRQIGMVAAQSRGGRCVASIKLTSPGLYRVSAVGGGFSPVEQLVAAVP